MLVIRPSTPKRECVYCETCGDCLTCEPECWCETKARLRPYEPETDHP
jgi:hypothetical protein